jgi:hypothetical protein
VLLVYSSLETRPEFLHIDRELARLLSQKMQKHYHDRKEKVTLVANSKVDKFKDEHPNWRSLGPEEIGEHFHADYVIDISIDRLNLYEPGSNRQLYRGMADITVNVINVHDPEEGPLLRKPYTCEYPRKGPVPVDFSNNNPAQFRMAFLNRVATDLSWLFVPHSYEDEHFHLD